MFFNYLKVAFRNIQRNKAFTVMNVFGLATGLATCLLIIFYILDEKSYDKYNLKADRIYRAEIEVKFGNNANSYAAVMGVAADELKRNFSEVEQVVRLRPVYEQPAGITIQKAQTKILEKNVIYADSSLFDVFTLPLIQGNSHKALSEPNTIVLASSTAIRYFGRTDVVGRTLILNDTSVFKVTGVMRDMPAQSHFRYDMFLSMVSLPKLQQAGWGGGGFNTYVLLKSGANAKTAAAKLDAVAMKNNKDWMGVNDYLRFSFTPLSNIHLHSNLQQELGRNGNIQYVYIFSAIAIFILLIACINFMNLSTARSSNRAREVGVRKVLGSSRRYLILQFLSETMITAFISMIIAIILAIWLLPLFNQVSGKELVFNTETFLWLLPGSLITIVVVGLIAGSYPAFFLSAFQPVDVLKGKLSQGFKGGGLRSFLVVFQFSVSVFLIIGTLVIYHQLNFIQTKNLGYNREQVLIVRNTEVLKTQAVLFKNKLKGLPGVMNVSMTSYTPTSANSNITALFPAETVKTDQSMLSEFWPVDANYVKTLGLQITAGRDFSPDIKTDSSAVIINEAAAKFLGFNDPLNKTIYRNTYGVQAYHVVGVIRDFHFKSLRDNITPVVLYLSENRDALNVKLNTAHLVQSIAAIKEQWNTVSQHQPFEYSFMDADFDSAYRSETRIGTIFISFTVLAIVIACLGLFGLAAYSAEQRTKEIGIRKVLGATVAGLVANLSVSFLKLVCISLLIASPLAWLAMQKWLNGFAYHTNIEWTLFIVAGIMALGIAFFTIGFQAVKAALMNPVRSLKSE